MRVLVFGDSITQGYWALEHGWVDRLRMHFDKLQLTDLVRNDEPSIFNLGVSADSSKQVLERIKAEVQVRSRETHAVKPVVILQIGVNDSSIDHGKQRVTIDEYKQNLRQIVSNVQAVASTIIFVGSSACNEAKTKPVFWGDYVYTNDLIQEYEQAMQEVAVSAKIPFIPVFDVFSKALATGEDFVPDGLHPNDAGHELIFQTVKPRLEELLA